MGGGVCTGHSRRSDCRGAEPEAVAPSYSFSGPGFVPATLSRAAAQAVGLRLGEIREIFALRDGGETPCGFVVDLIGRRAAELDARIAELQALRDELRSFDQRARRLDPRRCEPRLVCHVIDAGA